MPAVSLPQPGASAPLEAAVPATRTRRKRRRTVKRIVLSLFALAWIAGCVLVLSRVVSAVGIKCAGCPDCAGTAP
ncbi:MAG TPA: hypothetical protein VHM91_02100 [Verrucomicrobiales bacterium]|jgi:hypothetical protein|nr:hypothetical protein [Verrucomicrobiales bacterium]